MELRRLSLCLAFLLVGAISHSSEARHSLARRQASDYEDQQDDPYTDNEQADGADADEDDDVVENATILTKAVVYNVPKGLGVRLECKIDIPDAIVSWKKGDNGIIVLGGVMGDKTKYQKSGTDLIISNVTYADAGNYRCIVEQIPPVQIEHQLAVYERAHIISISASDNGQPAPGSDLTLTCSVTGSPAPEIIWTKMVDGRNGNVAKGAVHTIKNVQESDSGTYHCYVMGKHNDTDTKKIEISVLRKPRIHAHRTVINSDIGVEAFMQCTVNEDEPVTIKWYKGNREIDASRYTTVGTQSNFTVTPQSDDDFGTYTCRAICHFGEHQKSIELVERPIVERLGAEGQKLTWSVHSHQPLRNIEIQLLNTVDGTTKILDVPIPPQKSHEYDITHIINSDVKPGNYQVFVKVTNTKGTNEENEPIPFEQVEQKSSINVAGWGPGAPDAAHTQQPTTVLISTVLMYLLVRML